MISLSKLVSSELVEKQGKVLDKAVTHFKACQTRLRSVESDLANLKDHAHTLEKELAVSRTSDTSKVTELKHELCYTRWDLERARLSTEYERNRGVLPRVVEGVQSWIHSCTQVDGDEVYHQVESGLMLVYTDVKEKCWNLIMLLLIGRVLLEQSLSSYLAAVVPSSMSGNVQPLVHYALLFIPAVGLAFVWHRLTDALARFGTTVVLGQGYADAMSGPGVVAQPSNCPAQDENEAQDMSDSRQEELNRSGSALESLRTSDESDSDHNTSVMIFMREEEESCVEEL